MVLKIQGIYIEKFEVWFVQLDLCFGFIIQGYSVGFFPPISRIHPIGEFQLWCCEDVLVCVVEVVHVATW